MNNINDLSEEDDALMRLHEILFGMPGSKSMRKKNVLGWSVSESQRRSDAIKVAICATPELTVLKEICVMLDIDLPAGRPAIEARLIDFLTNLAPTADGVSTKIEPVIESGPTTPSSISIDPQLLKDEDQPEEQPPRRKRVRRGGRKKGSKNRTPEEKEAERIARLLKPRGRPGRKKGGKNRPRPEPPTSDSDEVKRRGRPLNFNEMRAFQSFVKSQFPNIFQQWTQMPPTERENYWVRYRDDI